MFKPGDHNEVETIAGYIESQLRVLRASAFGLTEEQARMTPCRSSLSIGGLLKHATYVCRGLDRREARKAEDLTPDDAAEFMDSFALGEGETLAGTLATFDEVAADYLAALRRLDPGATDTEPSAPWFGINEAQPSRKRYYLVHQVEELARHAGHADIIREQIDGATSPQLLVAVGAIPENPFAKAWTPPEAADQPG